MPAFMLPKFIVYDTNGDPLSGGKVYVYTAGTTTPVTTYSDSGLSTPNAFPVVLDSSGRADIWVADGNYKVRVDSSADVTLYTVDSITLTTASAGDVSQAQLQQGTLIYAASTSGTDTYAISLAMGAIAAYNAGMRFFFKPDTANTGAATLNVTNSDTSTALGAKTIVKPNGSALLDGDIAANRIVEVVYDGTNFQLMGYSDPVTLAGTQTLTNKTLGATPVTGNFTFNNNTGAVTKDTGGTNRNTFILDGSDDFIVGDSTVDLLLRGATVQANAVPVVTTSGTQTLSNKTILHSVNTLTIDTEASGNSIILKFGRFVGTTGVATRLPSGWSVARNSTGNYTVTHNYGLTSYFVQAAAAQGAARTCVINNIAANTVDILCYDATGTAADAGSIGFIWWGY